MLVLIARRFIAGLIIGIALGATSAGFILMNSEIAQVLGLGRISEVAAPTSTEKEEAQAATLITNDLKYAILDVRKSDYGVNGEKPLEGGIFVIVKTEIENIGKTEIKVFGKNWLLEDSKGRIYTPKSYNAIKENDDNIFSIEIPPGFKIVRDIGFEVPITSQNDLDLYVADSSFDSKPVLLGKII